MVDRREVSPGHHEHDDRVSPAALRRSSAPSPRAVSDVDVVWASARGLMRMTNCTPGPPMACPVLWTSHAHDDFTPGPSHWGLPEFRFMLAQTSFLYFAQLPADFARNFREICCLLTQRNIRRYRARELPGERAKKQRTVTQR